jgi:autotransporter strand-loop-strand O-heptosyltransferase
MFLEPNIHIHNVYAQYYIGAHKTGAESYAQLNVDEVPLQKMASHILGLKHFESQPWLGTRFNGTRPRIKDRYVCLSEHASDEKKYWREPDGWQKVVDYLNSQGIKVAVISREPTQLNNVIDLTGDRPIEERMFDLIHAECFLGVSSGLSWLAWGLHRRVIMVSDGTPTFHEFQRNCKRLSENNLEKIDYNYHMVTSWKKVVEALVDWGIS